MLKQATHYPMGSKQWNSEQAIRSPEQILKYYRKTQCENWKTIEDRFKKKPPTDLTHRGDRLQTDIIWVPIFMTMYWWIEFIEMSNCIICIYYVSSSRRLEVESNVWHTCFLTQVITTFSYNFLSKSVCIYMPFNKTACVLHGLNCSVRDQRPSFK